jgi:chemotaxis protein MotB
MFRLSTTTLLALTLMSGCASKKLGELQSQLDQCKSDTESCRAEIAEMNTKAAKRAEFLEARMKAYKMLAKKLRDAFGASDAGVEVFMRDGMLVVKLSSDILFASGSSDLNDGGKAALDILAGVLSKDAKGRQFLVGGHTDNVAVSTKSKKFRSNWELSAQRALVAVDYLVTKGVEPTSLGAVGFGEHRPVADNSTDEGKAKNRRVELIFMPTAGERPDIDENLDD